MRIAWPFIFTSPVCCRLSLSHFNLAVSSNLKVKRLTVHWLLIWFPGSIPTEVLRSTFRRWVFKREREKEERPVDPTARRFRGFWRGESIVFNFGFNWTGSFECVRPLSFRTHFNTVCATFMWFPIRSSISQIEIDKLIVFIFSLFLSQPCVRIRTCSAFDPARVNPPSTHRTRTAVKMVYFREAGLTYLQFSSIASRLLRQALKKERKGDLSLKESSTIKKLADLATKKPNN